MSQVFTADTTNLGTEAVRLGQIQGFVTYAELGTVGMCDVVIDNPAGTVSITGLKPFTVDEDAEASGNQRTFTGWIGSRRYRRRVGSSLITGAANEIAMSLSDLNAALGFRIITEGARPAETVNARLAWLLASDYLTGLVYDNGFVGSDTTDMDATDYTGQKPADVLGDMALRIGWNYFVYYDEAMAQPSLWFQDSNTSSDWGSGISLTNVLAEIDQAAIMAGTATTFYALSDADLDRNPDRVFAGVYLPYAKGYVYRTDPDIESNFAWRDGSAPNSNVKTAAAATAIADAFLLLSATEEDRITCTYQPVASQVNAVLAGQLVNVKFTHLPGYETDYVSMRVMKRTVAQRQETDQLYQVTLELTPANPEVLTPTFAELQEQAGPANGHASPYSATGPGDYEIVYERNGDNPDSGWPSNPKFGLVTYAPVYTDAGAPLGEYFRGLTVTGDGDVSVGFRFAATYLASGTDIRRQSVLANGIEVAYITDTTTGGLRFVTYIGTLADTISVVATDAISGLYSTTGAVGGSITIGGGLAQGIYFRINGSLV